MASGLRGQLAPYLLQIFRAKPIGELVPVSTDIKRVNREVLLGLQPLNESDQQASDPIPRSPLEQPRPNLTFELSVTYNTTSPLQLGPR